MTAEAVAPPDIPHLQETTDIASTAEYATVGAVALAASAIQDQVLGIVRDADFSDPRCKFTIGVIRRMRADNLPVDMVTVVGYVHRHSLLSGGIPRVNLASWLAEIADAAPVIASVGYYAELVVESAARRAATYAGQRVVAAAEGDSLADLLAIVCAELVSVMTAIERVGVLANV
ncbi:MAG: hypothetical protein M3Y77_02310 [Actinomycetota bacterium]|nr:hypothetical protein [Actinomycetota bacterium]